MTISRIARWRAGRAGSDEQGSLVLVLLLIMFMSIVVLTVTTGAFSQLNLGSASTTRNDTLESALSGVQSAVGDIRAASNNGAVDPSELPCSVSGSTNGSSTTAFSASIQYYAASPSGTTVQVTCYPGAGPQVTVSGDHLASAVVTSCAPANTCPVSGSAATTGVWRRVISTYTFETTNVNIPGGVIFNYGKTECLFAMSYAGGWELGVTNACTAGDTNYPEEQFEYTSTWNLTIVIDGTTYCVVDPDTDNVTPTLSSSCTANSTNPAYQWGIDDVGAIVGTNSAGTDASYTIDDPLGGTSIPAGTIDTEAASITTEPGGFSSSTSWEFSPSVGSGGAAPPSGSSFGPTNQLVNYEEFGLCMDVTNASVTGGKNVGGGPGGYLIDYDCKQFPDTTDYPLWNQRWCFDQITTTTVNKVSYPVGLLYTPQGSTSGCSGGSPYCATSPEVPANGTNSDTEWVTVNACTLNQTASSYTTPVLWTDWGAKGGTDYQYTWTDPKGYCLEADTANPQSPGGGASFSTIEVATCNGSYAEMWNAPPSQGLSQVSDTHEGTGDNWTVGNQ